jgi:heme-degrading monooxygenase HmoA
MLARVARYEVSPDRCDDAVKAFQESARDIAMMKGLDRGYVVVDSETGAIMTLTFWQNQASLDASETAAATARRRAISAVDGEVQSVQVFDVVREFSDS